ncbi:unnamed protein product [Rotaria sp. Silwood1]|nr:unnamed protein product [Rotaria sp. Silwood1]CAF1242918.1 unnamed protein product [Rotaria sp. Silwood1]CAF4658736.1 unnamed protein product [Rotaria sp. Silwood1]
MVDHRLLVLFLAVVLLVSVLHAERARNDNLQDEEDEMEGYNEDTDNFPQDVVEAMKRFLKGKKTTTTEKPSSDAIIALFSTTTRPSITRPTPSKPSIYDDTFGRKTSSTPCSTSRYGRTTKSTGKDACGYVSPCKNGGTCKTLSSGRYYCFCTQDYYGKHCENKFITSGNTDRLPKDHCSKSPCRNGGECVGLRTTYYCRCKSPYYGTNCDKRIGKREESIDESSSSEQKLEEVKRDFEGYKQDLEQDKEDLRRAIANENLLENFE